MAKDPAIEAAIAKAKAAGQQPIVNGANGGFSGSAFDQYASAGSTGTEKVWTIPLWRHTFKRPVRDVNADGSQGATYTTSGQKAGDQYSPDDASVQFGALLMDQGKMKEWSQLALRADLVSATDANDAAALNRAWNTAVGWAVNIKQASKGDTEVTPFEAAKLVAQNTGSALLAQQAYAADHFTGTRVISDGADTVIDKRKTSQTGDVLHQLLGRNPTAGEKATYQQGLNEVAAANPTLKESVGTFRDGVKVAQTDTLTGGYDEKAAAIEQANAASPDVAREQTATTFYDALVSALGAAV